MSGDLSVKEIFSVLFAGIAVVLLISVMMFDLVSTKVMEVQYAAIAEIEENGYVGNESAIDDLAQRSHTTINVTEVSSIDDEKFRYNVTVGANYTFAFINFPYHIEKSGTTRYVSY